MLITMLSPDIENLMLTFVSGELYLIIFSNILKIALFNSLESN